MTDFLTRMQTRRSNAERQQAIANHAAWLRNERRAEADWDEFSKWLERPERNK